jgi:hypothetical protein
VVGSFGVKEHSSCEVWKNFGDIWWNFGVFSGAKDLFIIIFGNRGSCCNSSNVQGQRHNLQEAQEPKCKIVRNYGSPDLFSNGKIRWTGCTTGGPGTGAQQGLVGAPLTGCSDSLELTSGGQGGRGKQRGAIEVLTEA